MGSSKSLQFPPCTQTSITTSTLKPRLTDTTAIMEVGKGEKEEGEEEERGQWSNPCDFFVSCLGYAVGLGEPPNKASLPSTIIISTVACPPHQEMFGGSPFCASSTAAAPSSSPTSSCSSLPAYLSSFLRSVTSSFSPSSSPTSSCSSSLGFLSSQVYHCFISFY